MMSTEEIEGLSDIHAAAAEKAFSEAMASLKYQDEDQKVIDQKAGILLGFLSAVSTVIAIQIANNIDKNLVIVFVATGTILFFLPGLALCLLSLLPRDWQSPVTEPKHWLVANNLKDEHGYKKTLLHLALYSDAWRKKNLSTVNEKADQLKWAMIATSCAPIGAGLGGLAFVLARAVCPCTS